MEEEGKEEGRWEKVDNEKGREKLPLLDSTPTYSQTLLFHALSITHPVPVAVSPGIKISEVSRLRQPLLQTHIC